MAVTSFIDGRSGFATAVPFDQRPDNVEKVAAGAGIGKYVALLPGID